MNNEESRTTEQEVAQLTLNHLATMLASERRKTREGAVALVTNRVYDLERLGKLARGESADPS